MKEKETIEVMSKLSEFGKRLPIFSFDFSIIADNRAIEAFLSERVDKEDWDGRALSPEDVDMNIRKSIEGFHKSAEYNPEGESKFRLRRYVTRDVSFDEINRLVSGKEENMPKNYKFVGEISLSNYE